jgi:hypothetical protein
MVELRSPDDESRDQRFLLALLTLAMMTGAASAQWRNRSTTPPGSGS